MLLVVLRASHPKRDVHRQCLTGATAAGREISSVLGPAYRLIVLSCNIRAATGELPVHGSAGSTYQLGNFHINMT